MLQILPPDHCPCCNSLLEWSNNLLYCRNISCRSTLQKRIEHFTKTLKIKGFGPKTVQKLGITSISEIYELNLDQIEEALNSELIAEKLLSEINNSCKAPANLIIPAFSIPLIGKTAAEKLSTTCDSIFDIDKDTCGRAGLGPKATENLLNWVDKELPSIVDLPLNFNFTKYVTTPKIQGTVCISGKLKSYKTKAEATVDLQRFGYSVKSSITKDVTILVNESGIESAKTIKARESGITIVTNLFEFLGEI
jgi:DNA ligase (NAD+)